MAILRARGGRSVTTCPSISDIAGGRPLQPGDHAHERGLAASGRAEQHEKFALLRGHVDAVDGAHLVESFRQSPCFNNGHDFNAVRSADTSSRMLISIRHCRGRPSFAAGPRNRRPLMPDAQIRFRSCHFAQIAFIAVSACSRAFSGVSAPVAALANIVLITQVLNASSIAAFE